MQPDSIFEALQFAVSPVILISAYGLLLLSMTNRHGRAIDRARQLAHNPDANSAAQVAIIMRRAHWIRSSILWTAIAITSAALLVLTLFLSVFLDIDVRLTVSALFVISIGSLLIALGFFIVDIFESLRALEADVAFARKSGRR